MKKLFLPLLLLLSNACFAQSFRASILDADVIVVGRAIYANSDRNTDYSTTRTDEAIIVHHYLKGNGADTLHIIDDYRLKYVWIEPEEDCKDQWDCYTLLLYCLKKYGNDYLVLNDIFLDKVNGQKYKATEERVSSMLRIANLPDERDRFNQTVGWMVDCYLNGAGELELADEDQFAKYYAAKGYVTQPIAALNSDQIQLLATYLQTKTSWDRSDLSAVKLLRNHLNLKAVEQQLLESITAYIKNTERLYTTDIYDILRLLKVVNPSSVDPYIVNELEDEVGTYRREPLRKLVDSLYEQWSESKAGE